MDLADFAHHIGPRPKFARCLRCKKRFAIKPRGRIRLYCSGACKVAVFEKVARLTRPNVPKPQRPRLPLDERTALRVWQMLIDASIIPADTPPPPRKQQPDGAAT